MNPYEEIVEGERFLRSAPGERHEVICGRLHECVRISMANLTHTRMLTPRSVVQLSASNWFRPDMTLVTQETGKIWLAAEIINSEDHRSDTVNKKLIYEELNIPRLWMVDPRYDNVEVYHGTPYGLSLKHILAGREILQEELLPELKISMAELFGR